MSQVRREMKRLCREARHQLGCDLDRSGRSMGRVGLSYARHHPTLLLGGGALLGTAIVAWFRRPRQKVVFVQTAESPKPVRVKKPAANSAWKTVLKSAVRMWLIDKMAGAMSDKGAGADEGAPEMEHAGAA
jgi:hypothetical protein